MAARVAENTYENSSQSGDDIKVEMIPDDFNSEPIQEIDLEDELKSATVFVKEEEVMDEDIENMDTNTNKRTKQNRRNTKRLQQPSDGSLKLNSNYGINALERWMEQVLNYKVSNLNQITASQLNLALSGFIHEIRRPSGALYAPDTLYYLCLGIQQYLLENGRADNIFTDQFYQKFSDNLDEIAQMFPVLSNNSDFIVTRVEEEHLWESKQLGAHSPQILISTLIYFNTKYFKIATVEEHFKLGFAHIMKHWSRNAKGNDGRFLILRFYPSIDNRKAKKVYEQHANEENSLRCPVKLFEFYMTKCPENVKNREDMFYLMPERSCVPNSPVWYSSFRLERRELEKILNRIKMVKEINMALLSA